MPHGMAVSLTAPAAFRFTFEAAPERHLRAARLLDPDAPADGPDALPGVLLRLMRDIGLPNGLAEVGYGEADVDDLVDGLAQAAAAAGDRPARRDRRGPGRRDPRVDGALVTTVRRTWSPSCAVAGVTDVDDSVLARALYSSDASLYRVVPQVVVAAAAHRRAARRPRRRARPRGCR